MTPIPTECPECGNWALTYTITTAPGEEIELADCDCEACGNDLLGAQDVRGDDAIAFFKAMQGGE